jgi:hypothetical protein
MKKKKLTEYIDMLENKINLNKQSKKVNLKKVFKGQKKPLKTDYLKIIYVNK